MVYCGHEAPVWTCKHALDVKKKCKYALCSQCYFQRTDISKAKRRRYATVGTKDRCDHQNLEMVTEDNYFKPHIVLHRLEKGYIIPTKCATCKRTFTSVKFTASI